MLFINVFHYSKLFSINNSYQRSHVFCSINRVADSLVADRHQTKIDKIQKKTLLLF